MRISLSTRIFLGFAVVIIAFGATAAYTIYRMTALRESVTILWEEVIPAATEMRELSRRIRLQEDFLDLDDSRDAEWVARSLPGVEPFQKIRRVEATLSELAKKDPLPAVGRARFLAVANDLRAFRTGPALTMLLLQETAGQGLPALDSSDTSEEAWDGLVRRTVKLAHEGALETGAPEARATILALRQINRQLIEGSREVQQPIRLISDQASSDEQAATLAVVLISLGATMLSLLMLVLLQLALAPIRQLREGARRIAAGDYADRVKVSSADEIGQLADEFNTMANALQARDRELARQRQELLRADRLATIGKMAAQITHEVRNPLSSIGLNAELLEEELEDANVANDEQRDLLAAIQREVDRLKAITEEYLRYARFPKPNRIQTDVGELITQLLSFLQSELSAAGVMIDADRVQSADHGGPAVVMLDPDQLRQALLNLARNAIEALSEVDEPRRLEVALEELSGGGVRIVFADDGPGVSDELAPLVFEPFVTHKSGGTGLGLALVQQVVLEHGGTIELDRRAGYSQDSERPGAVFTITLPAGASGPVVAGPGTG